jgi:streptogramin lyase
MNTTYNRILVISIFALTLNSANGQYVTTLVDNPSFDFTDDMIFDDEGNLYCSDYSGDSVFKRSPEGEVTVFSPGFDSPNGLAFDSQGNLFVCDNTADLIVKLSPNGDFLDSYLAENPSGLIKKLDSDTLIFTQYSPNNTLNKLAPDGTIIEWFNSEELVGPVGLDYDDDGQLYVANYDNREIYKVFENELEYLATVPGPSTGVLGFISYGGGKLWATSWDDSEIYAVELNGTDIVQSFAGDGSGGTDGPIDIATFTSPNGILATASGDSIYISEYNTGKLRVISPNTLNNTFQISQDSGERFQVFPNPTAGHVNVQSLLPEVAQILVFDTYGRKVLAKSVMSSTMDFYLETSGLYSVVAIYRDGSTVRNPVVVY